MKKLLLTAAFGFAVMATQELYAQQGFGTNTPDKSAAVEIRSGKRGLLIPRVGIPDLENPAPVKNPAISLFVYNDPTSVTPSVSTEAGFYYWDGDRWIRFVSSKTEKNVTVTAGKNVEVAENVSDDGLTTDYTVSVKGGQEGQVWVSTADGGTEWINPADFVYGTLVAGNGIGIERNTDSQIEVKFDGNLTESTTITTNPAENINFAISGLETTQEASDYIVIMNENGVLQRITKESLLDAKDLTLGDGLTFESGNGQGAVLAETKIRLQAGEIAGEILTTIKGPEGSLVTDWRNANSLVEVDNGLSKGTDEVIHLGGKLIEEVTTIQASSDNLLAITGLTRPGAESEVVYVESSTGNLRKSARTISAKVTADQLIGALSGYSDYVQEINVAARIGAADLNIRLPKAAGTNKGQVVNIKIENEQEPDAYLNIKDSEGGILTYGAMPYQGWIFKSTGGEWLLVGRN